MNRQQELKPMMPRKELQRILRIVRDSGRQLGVKLTASQLDLQHEYDYQLFGLKPVRNIYVLYKPCYSDDDSYSADYYEDENYNVQGCY